MFTRTQQIEAGLGSGDLDQHEWELLETEAVSEKMTALQKKFRKLQNDLSRSFKETKKNKKHSPRKVARFESRINRFSKELLAYYTSPQSEQERNEIIDMLVYMGTVMQSQIGLDNKDFLQGHI